MKRISDALTQSQYSIHDLSRVYGDASTNLARFNMPFEFGMAFQYAEHAVELGISHDWLGLLPSAHRHGEFISDLAGYDLEHYGGTPESLVSPVFAWLTTRPAIARSERSITKPGPIRDRLPGFLKAIQREDDEWENRLPWPRLVEIAHEVWTRQI